MLGTIHGNSIIGATTSVIQVKVASVIHLCCITCISGCVKDKLLITGMNSSYKAAIVVAKAKSIYPSIKPMLKYLCQHA
jgi:hypothetical protein